jgi:hypothetical protein
MQYPSPSRNMFWARSLRRGGYLLRLSLGLASTRRRPDITYAANYTLDTDNNPGTFTGQLSLAP